MENPKRIRRKNYLINKRFQLKYTGLILVFMFMVGLLAGYTVYYTGWLLMGEKLANIYPQGRLVAIMKAINLVLVLRLLLITPLVVLISILLSHRMAGPLFRIERYLRAVAKGDFSVRLHLRRRDELQDLAETINEMTDDLKGRVNKLKALINMANSDIEKLRISLGKELPDITVVKSEAQDLEKSIKELDDHLSEYRLTAVED